MSASSVSYADPYVSGRAPELVMFNVGFERGLTQDLTLAVNYVGNESHFIVTGSNPRGNLVNQLDPKYLAGLGPVKDSTGTKPILNAAATPANVAIVQQYMAGAPSPAFIQNAAAVSTSATIAQMLVAYPQYSTVTDTWGNVGNFSYHSLQITLNQRLSQGLTFNINFTYSKNIGDDATFRSGFQFLQPPSLAGPNPGVRIASSVPGRPFRFPRPCTPLASINCLSAKARSATIRASSGGRPVAGSFRRFTSIRRVRPSRSLGAAAVRQPIRARDSACLI